MGSLHPGGLGWLQWIVVLKMLEIRIQDLEGRQVYIEIN